MKKIITILVMATFILGVFVSCTQEKEKFVCDFCKKEVNSVPHEVNYEDKDIKICDDCYEGLKKLNKIK